MAYRLPLKRKMNGSRTAVTCPSAGMVAATWPACSQWIRSSEPRAMTTCECPPSPRTPEYAAVGTPSSSVTTPVQQPYSSGPPSCGRSATGCSSQRTRSAELTCPQAIRWCRAESGLYWKKTWYRPLMKLMPLGSLIQPCAGRGWKRGKAGSGWAAATSSKVTVPGWTAARSGEVMERLSGWREGGLLAGSGREAVLQGALAEDEDHQR